MQDVFHRNRLLEICRGVKRTDEIVAAFEAGIKTFIDPPKWRQIRQEIDALPVVSPGELQTSFDSVVSVDFSQRNEAFESLQSPLRSSIESNIPWRKGPFSLFSQMIDCEWQSNLKWDRLSPHLPDLKGKTIADIGCNNGYYMYRMLAHDPRKVIGFDPSSVYAHQFYLLQHFFQEQRLEYLTLGVEHSSLFAEYFDVILCLGVIYHRKDPITMLEEVRGALREGGTVFIESITIEGEDSTTVFPEDRYAQMRNVWFLPTTRALVNFMKRAKFREIEVISVEKTLPSEQRKTEFAPFLSLEDFLDPNDHTKTIEGYPAPYRTIVKAVK